MATQKIEFGTDDWGKWAAGVQERQDKLDASIGELQKALAEKSNPLIEGLLKRVEAVEEHTAGLDKAMLNVTAPGGKSAGKGVSGGKDLEARLVRIEVGMGLHDSDGTVQPEAEETAKTEA